MEKIKIAVVGCGGIANGAHLPSYKMMDNVKIVALCDIKREKAEKSKKDFSFTDALIYSDYEKMLNETDADAIDICTPNYLHSVIASKALEKGFNVFCEKPDAVNVEEALKMKYAAEKSKKLLMVMRNNRFAPSSAVLKNFIKEGKAGEIYCGRCGWIRRRGIPGKGGWFTTKSQSGGGPLIDLGVHMIDLAIWLMGNPTPIAVSGSVYTKFANNELVDSIHSDFGEKVKDGTFDVEDLAMGFIKFSNGACLQIEFSWASNIKEEENFVELRGTKAGFKWRNGAAEIYSEENGVLTDTTLLAGGNNGHYCNLKHFVDCLLNNTEPDFKIEQGVNMIKILTAIYESAKTGKEVLL